MADQEIEEMRRRMAAAAEADNEGSRTPSSTPK
jgi:hypothetical protein